VHENRIALVEQWLPGEEAREIEVLWERKVAPYLLTIPVIVLYTH
jgi:hypothetical protein